MKKVICVLLATLFFCTATIFADGVDTVCLYSMDGREITVYVTDVEAYKNVGWFENKSDVVKTMYAPDGRELTVYIAEIEAYKNVGWFENKSDVVKTMYAPDGRELSVYVAEIEAYKNVGWFENKSDVTKTMYAPDGRELTVYVADVEAYKNVGWFENKSDVTKTMYAPDGRELTVYITEVETYMALGWSLVPASAIDPAKPMVALTFDDGPHPYSTGRILDTLQRYNARATFFVLGNLAEVYPNALLRMKELGCQIGNHSYSHPQLDRLSAANISSQLGRTSTIITNITSIAPTAVRPPYGAYNRAVSTAAGTPLILWSIDTLDWKTRNADSVTNSVLSKVRDGDIVLMHDIYDSTATAAERIIPALLARGFQLVTVDELAYYKNKPMSAGYAYSHIR